LSQGAATFRKSSRRFAHCHCPEVGQLREWIENFLEDQLELTDEFNASIERGKRDIAEGNLRTK
jgi:hypothetical protein